MGPEAGLENLRTWPGGAPLRPDPPTYQPLPPPPEEPPPPEPLEEPGAVDEAAMAPEKPDKLMLRDCSQLIIYCPQFPVRLAGARRDVHSFLVARGRAGAHLEGEGRHSRELEP